MSPVSPECVARLVFGGHCHDHITALPLACYVQTLVLLRISSSRPNPRTFPQFFRVQILGFLAAENDGFETYVRKYFHLISQIYTTKTPSEWH